MGTCTFEIEQDSDAEDPRTAWDNAGTMVAFHNRYTLGDEDGLQKLEKDIRSSTQYRESWEDAYDFTSPRSLASMAERCGFVLLPVYLYDHSGLAVSTTPFSCRWDSGQLGFIYCTPAEGREEFGHKWRVKAANLLRAEVQTYGQYLSGEVYGYIVKDAAGEEADASWGYYGREHCEQAAKDACAAANNL